MREILKSVVEKGSGKNCYIPGYKIGGKTGTAQKYDDNGNVMTGKHIASFVAFAPADDPKIAVLIVIDEPNVAVDFGSVVAAPYVKEVLKNALPYMGVKPDSSVNGELKQVAVPDLTNMSEDDAETKLKNDGFLFLEDGTGSVTSQLPAPGTKADEGTTVLLYMTTPDNGNIDEEGMTVVPDLKGLSIMDAAKLLEENGLVLVIQGKGKAVSQDHAANEVVPDGTKVTVVFKDSG
jgi:stage V sporulation protein D (sporulation-specific penicillin-binding protein)